MGIEKYTGLDQAIREYKGIQDTTTGGRQLATAAFQGLANKRAREDTKEDLEINRKAVIDSNATYNAAEIEKEKIAKQKVLAKQAKGTKIKTVYSDFAENARNVITNKIQYKEELNGTIKTFLKGWKAKLLSEDGLMMNDEQKKEAWELELGSMDNFEENALQESIYNDSDAIEELNEINNTYAEKRDEGAFYEAGRTLWDSDLISYEEKLLTQKMLDQEAVGADSIKQSTIDSNRKYRSGKNFTNFMAEQMKDKTTTLEGVALIKQFKAISDGSAGADIKRSLGSYMGYTAEDNKAMESAYTALVNNPENHYSKTSKELAKRNKDIVDNGGDYFLNEKNVLPTSVKDGVVNAFQETYLIGSLETGYKMAEQTSIEDKVYIMSLDPKADINSVFTIEQRRSIDATLDKDKLALIESMSGIDSSTHDGRIVVGRSSRNSNGNSYEVQEFNQMKGTSLHRTMWENTSDRLYLGKGEYLNAINQGLGQEMLDKIDAYKSHLAKTGQTEKIKEFNESMSIYTVGQLVESSKKTQLGWGAKLLGKAKEEFSPTGMKGEYADSIYSELKDPDKAVLIKGIKNVADIFMNNDTLTMAKDGNGSYVPVFDGAPVLDLDGIKELKKFSGEILGISYESGNGLVEVNSETENVSVNYSTDGKWMYLMKDDKKLKTREGQIEIPTDIEAFERGEYEDEIKYFKVEREKRREEAFHIKQAEIDRKSGLRADKEKKAIAYANERILMGRETEGGDAINRGMYGGEFKYSSVTNKVEFSQGKELEPIKVSRILRNLSASPINQAKGGFNAMKNIFNFFNDVAPQKVADFITKDGNKPTLEDLKNTSKELFKFYQEDVNFVGLVKGSKKAFDYQNEELPQLVADYIIEQHKVVKENADEEQKKVMESIKTEKFEPKKILDNISKTMTLKKMAGTGEKELKENEEIMLESFNNALQANREAMTEEEVKKATAIVSYNEKEKARQESEIAGLSYNGSRGVAKHDKWHLISAEGKSGTPINYETPYGNWKVNYSDGSMELKETTLSSKDYKNVSKWLSNDFEMDAGNSEEEVKEFLSVNKGKIIGKVDKAQEKVMSALKSGEISASNAMEQIGHISAVRIMLESDSKDVIKEKAVMTKSLNNLLQKKDGTEIITNLNTATTMKDEQANLNDKISASMTEEMNLYKNSKKGIIETGVYTEKQKESIISVDGNNITRRVGGKVVTYPKLNTMKDMVKTVEIVAKANDLDPEFLVNLVAIETMNTFNPHIKKQSSPGNRSTVSGLGQIKRSSETTYGTRNEDGSNSSNDAVLSLDGVCNIVKRDIADLEKSEVFINNNLEMEKSYPYLMHQQGATGFKRILRAKYDGGVLPESTLTNMIGNIHGQSAKRHFSKLLIEGNDKNIASFFVSYWEHDYNNRASSILKEMKESSNVKNSKPVTETEISDSYNSVSKSLDGIYSKANENAIFRLAGRSGKNVSRDMDTALNARGEVKIFESLQPEQQRFLAKYQAMGLLKRYPNLVKGVVDGDYNTVESNYQLSDYFSNKERYRGLLEDIKDMKNKGILK